MIFAASAPAQEQDQRMMDRILNPDRERKNEMSGKSFEGREFSGKKFSTGDGYTGVKSVQSKEFNTRTFLGIKNPWFGKKVHETSAASQGMHRYLLGDRSYATREVPVRGVAGTDRQAAVNDRTSVQASRAYLARGKAQGAIDQQFPSTTGPLSIDEVRELLNRNR
jgi:hypothetical protein